MAGIHNAVYLSTRLEAGESVNIPKGYGLLVVSNITQGRTELYLLWNGNPTALSDTYGSFSISRISEFSVSIKNTTNNINTMAIACI